MDSGIDEVASYQKFDFFSKFSATHINQSYFIYFYFYFSLPILLLMLIWEDSSKIPKETYAIGYEQGIFYVIGYERGVYFVV